MAILARGVEPIVTHTALPGDPEDSQRRYIEAAVGGVLIASLYAPNGNPQPGPKFTYKLAWMERLIAHAADIHQTYLSGVEGGKRNPSVAVLDRIATALGSDISALFDRPGRAKRPTR